MAKQALVDVLQSTIGKYVLNLDVENLSLSLWSGRIEFPNGLELNTEALNNHEIMKKQGMEIQNGTEESPSARVGYIGVHVPWASLASKSVTITIRDVSLAVSRRSKVKVAMDDLEEVAENLDELKKETQRQKQIRERDDIRIQEETLLRSFLLSDETTEKKQQTDESFKDRLVRRIIENISIDIRNIHIQFCSVKTLSTPLTNVPSGQHKDSFSFGIVLESLSVFTTDKNGKRTFVDRSPTEEEFLFKSLEVDGFGMYLEEKAKIYQESTKEVGEGGKEQDAEKLNDHQYLIQPFSFEAFLRQIESSPSTKKKNVKPPSKYKISTSLPNLSIGLSRRQLELTNVVAASLTIDSGSGQLLFPQYRPKFRPTESSQAAREWWLYAFRCVHTLQYGYPNTKSSLWVRFINLYRKQKRYIILYKRLKMSTRHQDDVDAQSLSYFYHPLSVEENLELQDIENDTAISVEGVILWRKAADAQLRLEGQKILKRTKSGDSRAGGDKEEIGDGGSVALSIDELKQLDRLLEQEERAIESSIQVDDSSIFLESRFNLGSVNIVFYSSTMEKIATAYMNQIAMHYHKTQGGDMNVVMALSNLAAFDEITPDNVFPSGVVARIVDKTTNSNLSGASLGGDSLRKSLLSNQDKLLYVEYNSSTSRGTRKIQSIKLRMIGLEFIASPLLIKELSSLFTLPPPSPGEEAGISGKEIVYIDPSIRSIDTFFDARETAGQSQRILPELHEENAQPNSALSNFLEATTASMADGVSDSLVSAWKEAQKVPKKRVVDCEIDAPVFVLPQDCGNPAANTLVLDLGHLSIVSREKPKTNIKKWCEEIKSSSCIESYAVMLKDATLYLGTVGTQDWYSSGYARSDQDNLSQERESIAIVEPFSLELDIGLNLGEKTRIYTEALFHHATVNLSVDLVSRALAISSAWVQTSSPALDKDETIQRQEPSNEWRRSFLPKTPSLRVDGLSCKHQHGKTSGAELFRGSLKLAGVSIKIVSENVWAEARLASVAASASAYSDGSKTARLLMGCFYISSKTLESSIEPMEPVILFHTNVKRVLTPESIDQKEEVLKKMNDLAAPTSTLLQSSVNAVDMSITLSAADGETYRGQSIEISSDFSGVAVHWHIKEIEKLLVLKRKMMEIVSDDDSLPDVRGSKAADTNESDLFLSARQILPINDNSIDVRDTKVTSNTSTSSSSVKASLNMNSVGLLLYSKDEDSLLYCLTMSKTSLSYKSVSGDAMEANIKVGDLTIATNGSGSLPQYRRILGISERSETSLLSATYKNGRGLKLPGDDRAGQVYDTYAVVKLSPMNCVFLKSQVSSLVAYLTEGVLGTLTSNAASSTASIAKAASEATIGAQAYILQAEKFSVKIPQGPFCNKFVSVDMNELDICYRKFVDGGASGNLRFDGFTVKCHEGEMLVPDKIEIKITLFTPGPSIDNEILDSAEAVVDVSHSRFFLTKKHYTQLLCTAKDNFAQNDTNVNQGEDSGIGSELAASKQLAIADKDSQESQASSKSKSLLRLYLKPMEFFLCNSSIKDTILCMRIVNTTVEVGQYLKGGESMMIDAKLHNFEIEDLRKTTGPRVYHHLLRYDGDGSDDLFRIKYSSHFDGSVDIAVMIGRMHAVYMADLLNDALSFTSVVDGNGDATENATKQPLKGMTGAGKDQDEVAELSGNKPLSKNMKLSLRTESFCFILMSNFEKVNFLTGMTASSFVLQGNVNVDADILTSSTGKEIEKCDAKVNGDKFQVYTMQDKTRSPSVQIMEPLQFCIHFAYNCRQWSQPSADLHCALLSPIDISLSTQDVALLLGMSSAGFAESEETKPSSSRYGKPEAIQDELATIGNLENVIASLEEDPNTSAIATSDLESTVSNVSSYKSLNDASTSSAIEGEETTKIKVSATVSSPNASLLVINDLNGLDHALFRIVVQNLALGGECRLIETAGSSSFQAVYDSRLDLSIFSESFDSKLNTWGPLLDPWSISATASRGIYGEEDGGILTKLNFESSKCCVCFRKVLLENLYLVNSLYSDASRQIEGNNNIEAKKDHDDVGNYCLVNDCGYDISFNVEQEAVQKCGNGNRKHFSFNYAKADGAARKRVYGFNTKQSREVTVSIESSASEKAGILHIQNIDDQVDEPVKEHRLPGGILVFTQVSYCRGIIVLQLRSLMRIHNCTRNSFSISAGCGNSTGHVGELKSFNANSFEPDIEIMDSSFGGEVHLNTLPFPSIGIPYHILRSFVTEELDTKMAVLVTSADTAASPSSPSGTLDWNRQGKIELPSYSSFDDRFTSTFDLLCSQSGSTRKIGANAIVVAHRIKNCTTVDIFVRPRAIFRNDLPVSILLRSSTEQIYSMHGSNASDKQQHPEDYIHRLEPFEEIHVLSREDSVDISVALPGPTVSGESLKWVEVEGGCINVPLDSVGGAEPAPPLHRQCHFPTGDPTTYGCDILLSDMAFRSDAAPSSTRLSTLSRCTRMLSFNVQSIIMSHIDKTVRVEMLPLPKRDGVNTIASRTDEQSKPSWVILSAMSLPGTETSLVLLPRADYQYRLIKRDSHRPNITTKTTHPYYLTDTPIGQGGMQSTPVFWQNRSPSGYYAYRKLCEGFPMIENEVHLIPQYVIFNGSNMHLKVQLRGQDGAFLGPNEMFSVDKDPNESIQMKIILPDINAFSEPVKVDAVGFRACPIVRENKVTRKKQVVGSLAVQTAVGGRNEHLVVKIGNFDFGIGAEGKESKVVYFSKTDFFEVHAQCELLKISFLRGIGCKQPVSLSNKTPTGQDSSIEPDLVAICVNDIRFALQRKFRLQGLLSQSDRVESSNATFSIQQLNVEDCRGHSQHAKVFCSSSGINFIDLRVSIAGPIDKDIVDVDYVVLKLCNKEKGKMVVDTSESFVWAVLDFYRQIISASDLEAKMITSQNQCLLLETKLDSTNTYTPPRADIICNFRRVEISPFTLQVSFLRDPDATRYQAACEGASLVDYAMAKLKFSLDKAGLYFVEYKAKNIKGPPDHLMGLVSSIYISRLKYKWIKIMTAFRVEDWAALSGRNDDEDQFVAGDVSRSLGFLVGSSLQAAFGSLGSVIGGTLQAATEMVGLGAVGSGANTIISGIGTGAGQAFAGVGKGAGQVFGGVESGLNAAGKGLINGIRTGNVVSAIRSVGDGARIAAGQTTEGMQTAVSGAAGGLSHVGAAITSVIMGIWMAIGGKFIDKARSFNKFQFDRSPSWRWISFLVFTFAIFSNALLWLSFAAVAPIISRYFYQEDGKLDMMLINMNALLFLVCYGPGTILGFYLTGERGSRSSILMGSGLTLIGASLRYLSIAFQTPHFELVLTGQAVAAVGHPLLVNCIGRVSADWFRPMRREIATAVSFGILLGGVILGKVVSTFAVDSSQSGEKPATGVPTLLFINFLLSAVAYVFVYLFIDSAPSEPVSNSTGYRSYALRRLFDVNDVHLANETSSESGAVGLGDGDDPTIDASSSLTSPSPNPTSTMTNSSNHRSKMILKQCQFLLQKSDYWIIMISLSLGPMLILYFLIFALDSYVFTEAHPCKVSMGKTIYSIIAGFGLTSATIVSCITSSYKAYTMPLKIGNVIGFMTVIAFLRVLPEVAMQHTEVLYAIMIFLTLVCIALIPLYMENILECFYPIREDISTGIVLTFVYTFILLPFSLLTWLWSSAIGWHHGNGKQCSLGLSMNISIAISYIISVLLIICYDPVTQNKRMHCERRNDQNRRGSEEEPLLTPLSFGLINNNIHTSEEIP